MRCRTARRRLNAYLDGELLAAERSRMEEHLDHCEGCRAALERLRGVADALAAASAPPPVPEGFHWRLMARAAQNSEQSRRRPVVVRLWSSFSPAMRLAAAAMLVLGIGLGGLIGWDLSRATAKPPQGVAASDPNAVYGFDYLSEAPGGSLADAYLTLASAANGGGK